MLVPVPVTVPVTALLFPLVVLLDPTVLCEELVLWVPPVTPVVPLLTNPVEPLVMLPVDPFDDAVPLVIVPVVWVPLPLVVLIPPVVWVPAEVTVVLMVLLDDTVLLPVVWVPLDDTLPPVVKVLPDDTVLPESLLVLLDATVPPLWVWPDDPELVLLTLLPVVWVLLVTAPDVTVAVVVPVWVEVPDDTVPVDPVVSPMTTIPIKVLLKCKIFEGKVYQL